MDVYIGNLPSSITMNELRALHGSWDFNARFERRRGQDRSGQAYQYLLAHFDVDKEEDAKRLISQLDGLSYSGKKVMAREFVHRSYSNERRALNWRRKPWSGVERRCEERRGDHH